MCVCVEHVLMHMCAASDAWGVPRKPYCVPRVCATWAKCVKHKYKDQNMVSMISQEKILLLELTWVQFSTRMSVGHFDKHLSCNRVHRWWKMHEHNEICLNTCSNCHKGSTQIHKQQMGLSPIKNLERVSQKLRTPTHFRKIPNFENPN